MATISGGAGNDTLGNLPFDPNADTVIAADVFQGLGGADTVSAGDGGDTIFGGSIAAGPAGDTADGADPLDGGDQADIVVVDRGTLATSYALTILGADLTGSDGLLVLSATERVRAIGGTAGDTLSGHGGADTLTGGTGADTLSGGGGNDSLAGGNDADTLGGGAGADTLSGGGGADLLQTGADGAGDLFIYGKPVEGGDTIAGFVAGQDDIALSRAGFGIGAATTVASLLVVGAGAAAPGGSTQALLYDTTADTLSWDADGAGSGAPTLLAAFTGNPTLGAADIVLRF
jgi:Ca2+-binding RTX toxin-like protein